MKNKMKKIIENILYWFICGLIVIVVPLFIILVSMALTIGFFDLFQFLTR